MITKVTYYFWVRPVSKMKHTASHPHLLLLKTASALRNMDDKGTQEVFRGMASPFFGPGIG